MLEATDFIQINFLGKLSTSSLREKYQLRDKKIFSMRKTPSIFFYALKNRWGESTFLESETCSIRIWVHVTLKLTLKLSLGQGKIHNDPGTLGQF